jgi:hypothetical protein
MTTPIWPIEGVALGTPISGSLGDYLKNLWEANYTEGRCYPTLDNGNPVISGAADWTLSAAFHPVVPLNGIATPYHISAVVIESCDLDGVFELAIYHGAGHTLMSTYRFAQDGGFFGNMAYQLPSLLLDANEQVDAKLAFSDATAQGSATITVSVVYRILV